MDPLWRSKIPARIRNPVPAPSPLPAERFDLGELSRNSWSGPPNRHRASQGLSTRGSMWIFRITSLSGPGTISYGGQGRALKGTPPVNLRQFHKI
jgi:hypothetical protein